MSDFQHAFVGITILLIFFWTIGKRMIKSDKDEESSKEWMKLLNQFWYKQR